MNLLKVISLITEERDRIRSAGIEMSVYDPASFINDKSLPVKIFAADNDNMVYWLAKSWCKENF